MKSDDFKKMDEEFMKKTTPLRDQQVNPKLLNGFAASVERRLESAKIPTRRSFGLRLAVPVFAVAVLAFAAVTKMPFGAGPQTVSESSMMELAQLPEPMAASQASLTDEIEALRALGAWTADDEKATGVSEPEEEIAEVLG